MERYALVTGGSRGIGRAVCERLAQMGHRLLINYQHNEAEAQATLQRVRQAGSDGELLPFDVGDRTAVTTAIEGWQERHPDAYIATLVNNAGIRRDNLMVFMPEDDWQAVVGTSLGGFYHVTQAVLQPMLTHKYGRIISLASVSGQRGMEGQANYAAAKAGIVAATKSLALEVARRGVTVNAVAPGFIETDMTAELDVARLSATIPARRFGRPEEVAHLVGFLASPEAAYITGEVIAINGGLYT